MNPNPIAGAIGKPGLLVVSFLAAMRFEAASRVKYHATTQASSKRRESPAEQILHAPHLLEHTDFPATASGSLGGSELRGKLNGGGQTLVVRTGDGPIRLHRL